MKLISVRKLVAFDMMINNRWVIFAEMAAGAFGILALGFLLPLSGIWFWWFIGVGCNYIPMFLFALSFIIRTNHMSIGNEIIASNDTLRYNLQQWLIAIPFFFALLALAQECLQILKRVRHSNDNV